MIGIADILATLTAKGRPCKEGLRQLRVLKMPENFRNNGHIDPDLYEVCVKVGLFRKHAEGGVVDIGRLLNSAVSKQ